MIVINQDFLSRSLHVHGSHTRQQIEMLGIEFPPPKGWKKRLIGRIISEEVAEDFMKARLNQIPERDLMILNRRMWYRTFYMSSDHWKFRRKIALMCAGKICHRCGSSKKLTVHHLNYDRLYNERDSDLEVLCFTCHEKEHKDESKGGNKRKFS